MEKSHLVTVRSGERTLTVAEKLAPAKFVGHGPAIHGYERFVPAQALFVDLGSDMFLARARRAAEQDGHVGTGHRAYLPVHLTRLFTFTTIELRSVMPRTAEYFFNGLQQPFRLYRLAEVIDGPQLHGFHRILHLAVIGHDKERGRTVFPVHPFQQLRTVTVRQAQVGQDEVELLCLEFLAGRRKRTHMGGVHSFLPQPVADTTAEDNVILYNQYGFHECLISFSCLMFLFMFSAQAISLSAASPISRMHFIRSSVQSSGSDSTMARSFSAG